MALPRPLSRAVFPLGVAVLSAASAGAQASLYSISLDAQGLVRAAPSREGLPQIADADAARVIQAALDAGPPGGALVSIREGVYVLSETLSIPSCCRLEGAGDATVLRMGPGKFWALLANASLEEGNEGLTVANLRVEGGEGEVDQGILLSHASDCAIQNVSVAGLHRPAISLRYADRSRVEGCHLRTGGIGVGYGSHDNIIAGNFVTDVSAGHGINVSGGAGPSYRNTISGNHVARVRAGLGITIDGPSYANVVVGNIVEETEGDAINCEAWPDNGSPASNVIRSNIVRGGRIAVTGYEGAPARYNQVSGNVVDVGGRDLAGILLAGVQETLATDNMVQNAGYAGIEVGGRDNVVANNICQNSNQADCGWPAIALVGDAAHNIVTANRCLDDQEQQTQGGGIKSYEGADYNLIADNICVGHRREQADILLVGQHDELTGNLGRVLRVE